MRRAESHKAGRLSRSRDTLPLIDGASYGSADDAQRVLDWLARDADTLAALRNEHLLDVGETICLVYNGCGDDRAPLSQWPNGGHAQLGASARLLGGGPRLLRRLAPRDDRQAIHSSGATTNNGSRS